MYKRKSVRILLSPVDNVRWGYLDVKHSLRLKCLNFIDVEYFCHILELNSIGPHRFNKIFINKLLV